MKDYNRYSHYKPEIEFTNDPREIKEYIKLRKKIFSEYWNLKHFKDEYDHYDANSHIAIIKNNNECVGGARLITSKDFESLPMENEYLRLRRLFSTLELETYHYAELSRVIVSPELMNGEISRMLYQRVYEKAKSLSIRYIFSVAPVVQARNARMLCNSLGIKINIFPHISIPNLECYEGIKMMLSVTYIDYPRLDLIRKRLNNCKESVTI